MIKARDFATILAIGALAVLPGCSMFGGHEEAAAPAPTPAAAPAPAPAPTAEAPQEVTMTRRLTRQVQSALKHDGLYKGGIDGAFGPMTESAVSQFQTQNGMQATGRVDAATLQAMNIRVPEPVGGRGGLRGVPTSGGPGMSDTGNAGAMGGGTRGMLPPGTGAAGPEMNMNNSTNEPAAAAPPAPSTGTNQ